MMEYLKYVCAKCLYEQKEPGTWPGCGLPQVASCPVCDGQVVGDDACLEEQER